MDAKLHQVVTIRFRFSVAPQVGNTYYFPPNGLIEKQLTRSMQIPAPSNELPSTFAWGDGATLTTVTAAQLKNFLITLVDWRGKAIIEDASPYTFVKSYNSGLIPDIDKFINIGRSYIKFTDVTDVTTSTFILFEFYLKPVPAPIKQKYYR